MSRAKRKRRAIVPTSWIVWDEDIAKVFAAPEGWAPPAKVRGCAGRAHLTYSATFTLPEGTKATVRVRLEPKEGGGYRMTGKTWSHTLRTGSGAG